MKIDDLILSLGINMNENSRVLEPTKENLFEFVENDEKTELKKPQNEFDIDVEIEIISNKEEKKSSGLEEEKGEIENNIFGEEEILLVNEMSENKKNALEPEKRENNELEINHVYRSESNKKNETNKKLNVEENKTLDKVQNIKYDKEIKVLTEIKNIFADSKFNKKNENVELKITDINIVRNKSEIKVVEYKTTENAVNNKEEIKVESKESIDIEKKQSSNLNIENKSTKETLKNKISEMTEGRVKINESNKTIEVQTKTEDLGKVKILSTMNQGIVKLIITVEKGLDQYSKAEIIEIVDEIKSENQMEIEVEIKEEDDERKDKEIEKEKKKKRNSTTNGEFEKVMEEGKRNDKH